MGAWTGPRPCAPPWFSQPLLHYSHRRRCPGIAETLDSKPPAPAPAPPCRLYKDWNGGSAAAPSIRGVIGALSASCTMTLTMPLEVVRRRLQVQVSEGPDISGENGSW